MSWIPKYLCQNNLSPFSLARVLSEVTAPTEIPECLYIQQALRSTLITEGSTRLKKVAQASSEFSGLLQGELCPPAAGESHWLLLPRMPMPTSFSRTFLCKISEFIKAIL